MSMDMTRSERVLGDSVAFVRGEERVGELHPVRVTINLEPRGEEVIGHLVYEHPAVLTVEEELAVDGVGVFSDGELAFVKYIRDGAIYIVTPGQTVTIGRPEPVELAQ